MNEHDALSSSDTALQHRLAKLRQRPVDLSQLAARMHHQIIGQSATDIDGSDNQTDTLKHPTFWNSRRWQKRALAMAASIALIVGAGLTASTFLAPSTVVAAPAKMAAIYNQTDNTPHHDVATFDQARGILRTAWKDGPVVPTMSSTTPRECCTHQLGNRQIKCITLENDGQSMMLAVGHDREINQPDGERFNINGVDFTFSTYDGVLMLMGERDGRWVCLMGKVSQQTLLTAARDIKW
jgi:hypothetical protein